MPKNKQITTAEALRFAQEEIFENVENGNLEFINSFSKLTLKNMDEKGQSRDENTPIDYIVAGAMLGYALRYIVEQDREGEE